MAPLLIDLVESFTIVSWNYYPLGSHRMLSTVFLLNLCTLLSFVIFMLPDKLLENQF